MIELGSWGLWRDHKGRVTTTEIMPQAQGRLLALLIHESMGPRAVFPDLEVLCCQTPSLSEPPQCVSQPLELQRTDVCH